MLKKMLNNLHPAINKDPQMMPAISISPPSLSLTFSEVNGTIIIKNDILQLIGPSTAQFNLRSYTLGSLVAAINSQTGFSATLLQPSFLSAVVLIEGTYSAPLELPMFTSFLWQLLKPVAIAMIDALHAGNKALLEMVTNTSDGAWLDSFGEFFGVYRQKGEPDQLYAVRLFNLTVGPRVNNLAIQKAIQELNYTATVEDAGLATFDVNVKVTGSSPQGFVYTFDQLDNMVGLLKAAGTVANIILSGGLSDSVSLSDSISVTLRPAKSSWGSSVWGESNWS